MNLLTSILTLNTSDARRMIQYIYAKYGRERAALTAVVTSYRPRSALRDVGRALGIFPPWWMRYASSIQACMAGRYWPTAYPLRWPV